MDNVGSREGGEDRVAARVGARQQRGVGEVEYGSFGLAARPGQWLFTHGLGIGDRQNAVRFIAMWFIRPWPSSAVRDGDQYLVQDMASSLRQ
jgi:hypothetical protein